VSERVLKAMYPSLRDGPRAASALSPAVQRAVRSLTGCQRPLRLEAAILSRIRSDVTHARIGQTTAASQRLSDRQLSGTNFWVRVYNLGESFEGDAAATIPLHGLFD
jgi:hypothetical protein